jgi:hypothetical protein
MGDIKEGIYEGLRNNSTVINPYFRIPFSFAALGIIATRFMPARGKVAIIVKQVLAP